MASQLGSAAGMAAGCWAPWTPTLVTGSQNSEQDGVQRVSGSWNAHLGRERKLELTTGERSYSPGLYLWKSSM